MLARRFGRLSRFGAWIVMASLVSCGEQSGFVNKQMTLAEAGLQDPNTVAQDDATAAGTPTSNVADVDPFAPGDPQTQPVQPQEPANPDLPNVPVTPDPGPVTPPVAPPAASPLLVQVDTAPVAITADQTRTVTVQVDEGSGARPPGSDEITVVSANPAIATVRPGSQPGQFVIVPVAPGQTQVTVTTKDDAKVIPVQVVPGVPVIRLGVNFEDIPTGGDLDYNDAVFCFSGKFAHDNHSVVSLAPQYVSIAVTNRSGCDHLIYIAVVDPDGTRREVPIFRSRSQPTFNAFFKTGSKLDVRMHVADNCLANTTWVNLGSVVTSGPNTGRPLVEVLNNVCRTTGN